MKWTVLAACAAAAWASGARAEGIMDQARSGLNAVTESAASLMPGTDTLAKVPDFSSLQSAAMAQFTEFTDEIGRTTPVLERLGYEVSTFRVQWGLPPRAKLRLRSVGGALSDEEIARISKQGSGSVVANALLSSAAAARRIQRGMGFGTAVLDVDFAVPPRIKMSFLRKGQALLDDGGRMEDLDLLCGAALGVR